MPDKRKRQNDDSQKIPFVRILISASVFSGIYFLFIALFSAVSLKSDVDSSFYAAAGLACGALSGFSNGFICVGNIGHGGFLYGGLSGLIQGIICSVGLIVPESSEFGAGVVLLFAVTVIFSCIGGILRVNRKKRIRY